MTHASGYPEFTDVLAQLPGFETRPAQVAMAKSVDTAIRTQETVVIEAGTGSGKSLAYLIPALLSNVRPILVSTATIALQEQLLHKDVPFVADAMGLLNLDVRLVKGRRNYLCIQKLMEFEKSLSVNAAEQLYVRYLKSELEGGWTGDKALLDLEIPEEIWYEVQSDSEDCLGKRCAYFKENPYRQARESLNDADVLIVNHSLYLQDLMANQAILPPHDLVIFDEAHHLHDIAMKALTTRISKFSTQKLMRKIHKRLQPIPGKIQEAIIETEARILQWLFQSNRSTFKILPDQRWMDLVELQLASLDLLSQWLNSVNVEQMPLFAEAKVSDPGIKVAKAHQEKLTDQLENLKISWTFFQEVDPANRVNWASVNNEKLYYEVKSTPLDVADMLNANLWEQKTAVLTSATLALRKQLTSVRESLGIASPSPSPDRVYESPFKYSEQCQLYLPQALPDPNDSLYLAAISDEILSILAAAEGDALVLFTSMEAMRVVSQHVIPRIGYSCKTQGDLPKHRLIEWFKETPNSILFATASFWEGVDIPGDSLRCVIMDRIPFNPPDEPVHQALINRYKRLGKNWFNDLVLPQAAIKLKQGFGRLIRTQSDSGLVSILDPRLQSKGYGKTLLASLPPAKIITSINDAFSWQYNDTSTTSMRA